MLNVAAIVFAATTLASNLAGLVNPFVGTAGAPSASGVGLIDDFPGASAPFGMVQWSPDTPSMVPSGGYFYRDKAITGFSVNHLSGAGCPIFGDFAMLPTVGDVSNPQGAQVPFTHDTEEASPGYYGVTLGNGVRVQLAATARTGYGRFSFPATSRANLLINTSSDQSGIAFSEFHVVGDREVVGTVHSGGFCGMPNQFHAYVAIRFDRPFIAYGTWQGAALSLGSKNVSGGASGGWVTFDTSHERSVNARVGLSYTSVDGARKNLAAGSATNVEQARVATTRDWNHLLGELQVTGGTIPDRRMLYTMLYHALLSPTLYSDADGSYLGFDGKVHRDPNGHDEYANFSSWDIYRTQIPLIALLAPHQTSDMMQTLVHNAQQGGWMPSWPVANGYTGEMGGDSAAPIVAGAYAFGARDFDVRSALDALVKNAQDLQSPAGQGWYRPRTALDEYLRNGYIANTHTTNGSPVTHGGSVTLEYALDDFSIAQLSQNLHRGDLYRVFAQRAMNWTNVFDSANRIVAPRDDEGAFEQHLPINESGQSGFEEGNAEQYTWMVPQSQAALVKQLGGPAATIARLDAFFTKLNAGWNEPYAWLGNEPTIGAPWTYLYAGAAYKADEVNRQALLTLYALNPDGMPGNDDLGTMSAWWVWNAIGLYPLTPGTPVLLSEASLFRHVSIASPSGRTIVIDAPAASDPAAYLTSLRVNGVTTNRSWVRLPAHGRLTLGETVSATPNTQFGSATKDLPPSYEYGSIHFPPATLASLVMKPVTIDIHTGVQAQLQFSFANAQGAAPETITWQAQVPAGFTLAPAQGTAQAGDAATTPLDPALTMQSTVEPGLYDIPIRANAANGAIVRRATAVVRVLPANGALPLAYVTNANDNTMLPIDPRTHAFGNPIKVGGNPSDLAVSRDGTHVYVANQNGGTVSVIDTLKGKAVAVVRVGSEASSVRLSPDGKTAWVVNNGDNTVQAFDTATLQADAPITVGSNPSKLAISPDGSTVYVVDQGSNDLAIVDTATKKMTKQIPLGGLPMAIALSLDGTRAYVSNEATSSVFVIDTKSLMISAQVPVGVLPQGLAVSPSGDLVYVAGNASSDITPIDTRTNAPRAAITVGNLPVAVAFARDGKTAFVANSGDNTVAVIDVASGKVIARIPTGNAPSAISLTP